MAKQFDKAKWLEEKAEKLEGAKKALDDGLRALQSSDDWKRMLEAMAVRGKLGIGRLSFANQVLLISQRPWVRLAATFMTWKGCGRAVKKGEKAMVILAPVVARKPVSRSSSVVGEALTTNDEPSTTNGEAATKLVGFRPLAVFAEDQTEGEPIPQPRLPDVTAPEAFDGSVETLRAVALSLPGEPVSGVELRQRADGDNATALGWYNQKTRHIVVVDDGGPRGRVFATLCHELAHALLHPLGDPHGTPEREVEAESTAFVVCHALGLDTGAASFPYVATWARRDGVDPLEAVATSGERISKAATRILDALCGAEERPSSVGACFLSSRHGTAAAA